MVLVKEKNREEKEIKEKVRNVKEALIKAGFNPEEYLVIRNGEVVPDEEKVNDNDILEIVKVVSGG